MDPQIDSNLDIDMDMDFVPDFDSGDNFDGCELNVECREQMKCEFPQGDNVCKRCKAGGHACIVEGRKPRSAPKSVFLLSSLSSPIIILFSRILNQLPLSVPFDPDLPFHTPIRISIISCCPVLALLAFLVYEDIGY
ncbi:putative fungal specific transcription factor [Sanghuangporus baumii]|uniref:Fungal specific transcription factor n=1 Tax=Sanghuangporus baumii TaxID=108892 RepID=A0A9Q5I2P2_SANBA|nr:putative fungal specific transcription factor [Sanghuangporus baumii]